MLGPLSLIFNTIFTLLQFTFTGPILNILVIVDILRCYPLAFLITVVVILFIYKVFIFLGFNQKRSIKLSSPYLNGDYYLNQLAHNTPDPHTFYHLEPGFFSRPMYCFVCDANVNGWNNEGLCCDICGYTVHQKCITKNADLGHCKNISTFSSLQEALHYCNHTATGCGITTTVPTPTNTTSSSPFSSLAPLLCSSQPSSPHPLDLRGNHIGAQNVHQLPPTQNNRNTSSPAPPAFLKQSSMGIASPMPSTMRYKRAVVPSTVPTAPTSTTTTTTTSNVSKSKAKSKSRSAVEPARSPVQVLGTSSDEDVPASTPITRSVPRRSSRTRRSTALHQHDDQESTPAAVILVPATKVAQAELVDSDGEDDISHIAPRSSSRGRGRGQALRSTSKTKKAAYDDTEPLTPSPRVDTSPPRPTPRRSTVSRLRNHAASQVELVESEDEPVLNKPSRPTTRLPVSPSSNPTGHDHDHPTTPLQYFPSHAPTDFPLTHHWVLGNHSSISDICFLCGDPVGSVFSRLGMHCLWCGLHVHETCLSHYTPLPPQPPEDGNEPMHTTDKVHPLQAQPTQHDPYVCNLGALAKAIIPPHCIYPGPGYTVASARYDLATKYTHAAIAKEKQARGEVVLHPSSFNTAPKLDFPQLFQFTLPSWSYPLLVIINRKSGGNGGVEKMHDFVECLNPLQVWDLSTHPAELPLVLFKQSGFPFRVLVCGGDGTFSSVLHSIDHVFGIAATTTTDVSPSSLPPSSTLLQINPRGQVHVPPPPVATLPLGTGNDLAQVLGWGGKNPQTHPRQTLYDVMNGRLAVLDRWDVSVSDREGKKVQLGPPPPPPLYWKIADYLCRLIAPLAEWLKPVLPIFMPVPDAVVSDSKGIMNNYIGFGLDAVIAHQFAGLRASYPHLFVSQLGNKVIYGRVGVGQWIYPVVRNGVSAAPFTTKFYVDGIEVTNIAHLQGVCCLGIKSFGGGSCFWGDRSVDENTAATDPTSGGKFKPPALDDGMFELIGFESSAHILMIQTGQALPWRLAQGRKLEVEILGKLPVQIDGEQWGVRENCRITVQLRTQSLMIVPLHSGPTQLQQDNLGRSQLSQEVNVTNMLHDVMQTGVQSGIISSQQSSQLMIDFTKKFIKVNPSSHFYRPSHDLD